jgi:hypothetical protein
MIVVLRLDLVAIGRLLLTMSPGMNFLDVGANMVYYSVKIGVSLGLLVL